MPWYGFIHPLMALSTLGLGLVTAQTSMSKITEWDFPLRRQRYRTVVFFLLTVANFIVGLLAMSALRGRGFQTKLTGHMPLAIVTMAVAMLASLVSFARHQPGGGGSVLRFHSILMVAALALILTTGFLTLLAFWG